MVSILIHILYVLNNLDKIYFCFNFSSSLIKYLVFSKMNYNIASKYMFEIIQKIQRLPDPSNIPHNLLQYAKEEFFNYSVSKGETR